jgi:hypothetical protein
VLGFLIYIEGALPFVNHSTTCGESFLLVFFTSLFTLDDLCAFSLR